MGLFGGLSHLSKRALVTGAGARLGQAMAIALGEDGWQVAIHYRSSKSGAEDTAQAIAETDGESALVQADLSNETEAAQLINKAGKRLGGPLTLLINSASTFVDDSAQSHSRKDWDFHMEANLARTYCAFTSLCKCPSRGRPRPHHQYD